MNKFLVPLTLICSQQVFANWSLKETDAAQAWSIARTTRPIVVAVIDTGVDGQHPDLQGRLWTNPGETGLDSQGRDKATNGIDDDRNGYVDDVHGWNFVKNNNSIGDQHGHGTHVAGLIAARGSNSVGVKGGSPSAKMMVLKYYDPDVAGPSALENSLRALRYAVDMHADIINYSGGGPDANAQELALLLQAERQNILVVAAAGNAGKNLNKVRFFPASYGLSNILSVSSINPELERVGSSNYGGNVHLAAPGEDILSTLPGGLYGTMTGTSQATAIVSGIAALLLSQQQTSMAPSDLILHLQQTARWDDKLKGQMKQPLRISSYRALAMKGDSQKRTPANQDLKQLQTALDKAHQVLTSHPPPAP